MHTATHSSAVPAAPASSPVAFPGVRRRNRFFWGMPHTDTDTHEAEAALRDRAADVAAGKYAAAAFAHDALDRVTRRSTALLQVDVIFVLVVMALLSRMPAEQTALFVQMNRWAFMFALTGCVVLMSNLRLTWGSNAAEAYGDPHSAFVFAMGVYKGRAWRYTLAHVLSFVAFALTLVSVTQIK